MPLKFQQDNSTFSSLTAVHIDVLNVCEMCKYVCGFPQDSFFRRVRKIAKSDYLLRHVCLSPHGKTRLPMDGFSLSLIFEDFTKICRDNLSSIKTSQE